MSADRCAFCRIQLEFVPEGMSRPRVQGKLACERCVELQRAPLCLACGERVRDAKKRDPEPYHENCRRCSSCHQVIAKSDVQKVAGKLLCGSCSNLFGQFFCPERRPEVQHLKETFSAWDNDGSGVIEPRELGRVLKALDPNFSDLDIAKLIRNIDSNSDGLIDFQEFCDWVMLGDKAFDIGEDSFEQFLKGLMSEAGYAVKQSRMMVREVHIREDGVWFVLESQEQRKESSALRGNLDLALLDPEEFITSMECTESGLVMILNTGREVKIKARGHCWGPWVAPDGFHIVGLRAKPSEDGLAGQERIVGIDCSPLQNAKVYDVSAALRFAAENEFLSTLRSLLPKVGGNLDGYSPGGVTALMLASQNGNVGSMRMLLNSKAHIDFADADGWTALTYASRCGQTHAVQLLLEKGATQEGDGGEALRFALSQAHNSAARALLRAGFGAAPRGTFALEEHPDPGDCKLALPSISVNPGAFSSPVVVALEPPGPCGREKMELFYTLDGRDPYTAGIRYHAPLRLSKPHNHLRIVARQGKAYSAVAGGHYVVCHYIVPDEIVTGSLRVRIFEEAAGSLRASLASVFEMPLERVMVQREKSEASETGACWLTITLRDPAPRHRLHIQRPFTLVRAAKAKQAFVENFTKDVAKAVGQAPSGIELSAGSIIVDFTMPRHQADELGRQLHDSSSFLLTKAKSRQHFQEASLSVVASLGDRLEKPETHTDIIGSLAKKAMSVKDRDVVCLGHGETGVIAYLGKSESMKNTRKAFEKTVKDVLPDCVLEGMSEGPENIEISYTVDVVCEGDLNGGKLSRDINNGELGNNLEFSLQQQGFLAARVATGSRATSRPVSQLEFHLKWDFPLGRQISGVSVDGAKKDYLDGICMVYCENRLAQIIDFRSAHEEVLLYDGAETREATEMCKAINRAIRHSGDEMSDTGGEQCLQIDLGALPFQVTDVYFVLAAFEMANLADFPNPAVGIYDAHSRRQLTEYHLASAGESQAIVMCNLTRHYGRWVMHGMGVPSEGCVKRYEPIRELLASRQEEYLRWDHCKDLMLLRALVKTKRITKASTNDFALFLWGVIGLPIAAFQLVMGWL